MKIKKDSYLFPDEIFMDSESATSFNAERFEGFMEKPIGRKIFIGIASFFIIIAVIFLGRVFSLQIVGGENFKLRSENNRLRAEILFPDRGVVSDRNGAPLIWNDSDSRIYTSLPGFSHILGYISRPSDKDVLRPDIISPDMLIGKNGVEQTYGSILSGRPGSKLTERDSKGTIVSESTSQAPEHGKGLILTIDSELQTNFFSAIKSVVDERGFTGGAGVIMDVQNGEVLALASAPEYDSNILSSGKPAEEISRFLSDKKTPFLNRAVSGIYEPGSTIKPIIAAGALAEGVITPEKNIFSSGSIAIPNPFQKGKETVFKDWKAHGWVDVRRALAFSSDVYFYEVGGGFQNQPGLGIKRIENYAKKFGFDEETGIDLPGEGLGVIPSPEVKKIEEPNDPIWRIGDTYHTAIGQGLFRVTPIRMAVFASAIANYGKLLKPHIFLKDESGGAENPDAYVLRETGISRDIFQIIHEGMRRTVLEGTATALDIPGVEIAAKSGTAQLGVSNSKVNSWIIGFFPYEKPKYAFAVVLEKGNPHNLVGALYAVRQTVDWMMANRPEYLK